MSAHLTFYQYDVNEFTLDDATMEKTFPAVSDALDYLITQFIKPRLDVSTLQEWIDTKFIKAPNLDNLDEENDLFFQLLTLDNTYKIGIINEYFQSANQDCVSANYCIKTVSETLAK
jgi:hypothetical protein